MLVHHFEAETQGFQGLVDQNDLAKALVPEQLHFPRETFFSGSSGVPNHSQRRPQVVLCISFTKQFLFLMYLVGNQSKKNFRRYIKMY